MNPFGTRGRAQELAALLDGAVVSGAYDAPAVALVGRLRAAGTALSTVAAPREEFRTALRGRLLAVAAVQGIGVPVADVPAVPRVAAAAWTPARLSGSRGLGVAAGAMASVVAVTGVAVASQRSLPGDPFYGAKRATEALQLRFADGDVERGTQHLEHAGNRLREVRALALGRDQLAAALTPVSGTESLRALGGSLSERVGSALDDMDEDTTKGSRLLEGAFRESGEVEPLRVLATFARRQATGLEAVLPSLPVDARSRAQESLSLVTTVAQQTELRIQLGTCGEACDPQTAGPSLPPASPKPVPGVTASPTPQPDCGCATPDPGPTPTPEPVDPPAEPTAKPTSSPSPAPTSSPAPQPSSITPTSIVVPSAVPVPSGLPTVIPLPPVVLPTGLTEALPLAAPLSGPQPGS